jgi:hypothetical protein
MWDRDDLVDLLQQILEQFPVAGVGRVTDVCVDDEWRTAMISRELDDLLIQIEEMLTEEE